MTDPEILKAAEKRIRAMSAAVHEFDRGVARLTDALQAFGETLQEIIDEEAKYRNEAKTRTGVNPQVARGGAVNPTRATQSTPTPKED